MSRFFSLLVESVASAIRRLALGSLATIVTAGALLSGRPALWLLAGAGAAATLYWLL